jgi:hypothetical protein
MAVAYDRHAMGNAEQTLDQSDRPRPISPEDVPHAQHQTF